MSEAAATDTRWATSSPVRPAILVLLSEHKSHGYELVGRLADLGIVGPAPASLYRMLRAMEQEGLLTASWDLSDRRGPARRTYSITAEGTRCLRELGPVLVAERYALGVMLARYRALVQQARRPRRRGRTLLVVDPDTDVRHLVWAALERRGWSVHEASAAQDALDAWALARPDVVVVDHRVAGMTGVDLARKLRALGFEGPVVLYSAHIDDKTESHALSLGAHVLHRTWFGHPGGGRPDVSGLVELFATELERARRGPDAQRRTSDSGGPGRWLPVARLPGRHQAWSADHAER